MDYNTVERSRLAFYLTVAREWGKYCRLDNQPRCTLTYIPDTKPSFETLGKIEFAPYMFNEHATLDEQLFVENILKSPVLRAILGAVGNWIDAPNVLRLSAHYRQLYDTQVKADLTETQGIHAAHNRKDFLHRLLEEILPYGDIEAEILPHRYFCKMFPYANNTQPTNYDDIALLCLLHSGLQYMMGYFSVPLSLVPKDQWFELPNLQAVCRVTSDTGLVWVSFCDPSTIVPQAQKPLSWSALQGLYYAELANPTSDGAWRPEWASPPANEKYNLF